MGSRPQLHFIKGFCPSRAGENHYVICIHSCPRHLHASKFPVLSVGLSTPFAKHKQNMAQIPTLVAAIKEQMIF